MVAWRNLIAGAAACGLLTGCASISGAPKRLYTVEEESQTIRQNLDDFKLVDYSGMGEDSRMKYRNDWIAARMYAIDMQYTEYEAALTRERQDVGFGAAATTLGLTTASGLATSTVSKDILTGLAGAVTGARAAYDNDVLLAHSVQWVQSQMRTQRTLVAERILKGLKLSTTEYPLAAAVTDLEDYYRAGTFTGGMLGTTATLGAEAKFAELIKQDRVELTYVRTAAGKALEACVNQKKRNGDLIVKLMTTPSHFGLAMLFTGASPDVAQALLNRARSEGICH